MTSLCQKYQKAKAAVETMNSAAEELTKSIGNRHWILEWKKLEEVAKTKRGGALMIYNVSDTPGMLLTPVIISLHLSYNRQLHHKQKNNRTSSSLVERTEMFSGC